MKPFGLTYPTVCFLAIRCLRIVSFRSRNCLKELSIRFSANTRHKMLLFHVLFCFSLVFHVMPVGAWVVVSSSPLSSTRTNIWKSTLRVASRNNAPPSSSVTSGTFPMPLIWLLEQDIDNSTGEWCTVCKAIQSKDQKQQTTTDTPDATEAAIQTWNWCRNFVLKLQLCPWAKASLETSMATQIFVVKDRFTNTADEDDDDVKNLDAFVEFVSKRFLQFIDHNPSIESAAIFFVVFCNLDDEERVVETNYSSFLGFYDWFVRLEEEEYSDEDVIIAPFHPNWDFVGESPSLKYEKKSPYPTVSIVSAKVVEQAGEAATEKIATHNEQLLLSKTSHELQDIWESSLAVIDSNDT